LLQSSSMIFYLRWLAAPPILWTKMERKSILNILIIQFFWIWVNRESRHMKSHYMYHQQKKNYW